MENQSQFYQIFSSMISNVWRLFTSITIPSTDIPFSAFVLALMLIRFSIWMFTTAAGGGFGKSSYGKPAKPKKKEKVSPYRRPFNDHSSLGTGAKGIGSGTGLTPR
jgi:hypothetical protein